MDNINEESIFQAIAESAYFGNLGLFVGSGFTKAVINNNTTPNKALSWGDLIEKAAIQLKIPFKMDNYMGMSYPDIASELSRELMNLNRYSNEEAIRVLKTTVADLTSWYPDSQIRNEFGQLLVKLCMSWIITTNYDLVIESLLSGICESLGPEEQFISNKSLIPVFHLHGVRTNPDKLILTREDYVSLFRPGEYRQQRLALTLIESTVVFIGYGLNDINVLTAVDWSNSVYTNRSTRIPHKIIQFLWSNIPNENPYITSNNVIVYEYKHLSVLLDKLASFISEYLSVKVVYDRGIENFNSQIMDPNEATIKSFVDNSDFRIKLLKSVRNNYSILASGFLELFTRSIDLTWERTMPSGAFYAYNENLIVTLDTIFELEIEIIPPALFQAIAYNLERLADYIGSSTGYSFAAYDTWQTKAHLIPPIFMDELSKVSVANNYIKLQKLLKRLTHVTSKI